MSIRFGPAKVLSALHHYADEHMGEYHLAIMGFASSTTSEIIDCLAKTSLDKTPREGGQVALRHKLAEKGTTHHFLMAGGLLEHTYGDKLISFS